MKSSATRRSPTMIFPPRNALFFGTSNDIRMRSSRSSENRPINSCSKGFRMEEVNTSTVFAFLSFARSMIRKGRRWSTPPPQQQPIGCRQGEFPVVISVSGAIGFFPDRLMEDLFLPPDGGLPPPDSIVPIKPQEFPGLLLEREGNVVDEEDFVYRQDSRMPRRVIVEDPVHDDPVPQSLHVSFFHHGGLEKDGNPKCFLDSIDVLHDGFPPPVALF